MTSLTKHNEKCAIYTYYPFSKYLCAKVIPAIINYFENESFQYNDTELFSEKMENLYGCPVTVATFHTEPHMMLSKSKNAERAVYDTDGIDGIILRVLSQLINFKPIIKIPQDGKMRGSAYANGTKTGAMRMVWYYVLHILYCHYITLNIFFF